MTFFAPKEHPGITDNFQTEFGYGISGMFYSPKAVEAQAGVIRKIAGSENCVMLGRCSDYFLQDLNSTLSIFVYAPLSYRVTHISQAYGLTQKQAQKMIAKIDRKRHRYYKYITGKNLSGSAGDDHNINSVQLSRDEFHAREHLFFCFGHRRKKLGCLYFPHVPYGAPP